LSPRSALAAHAQVVLDYERGAGGESCAGAEELRRAVATRLGYDPFVTRAALDTIRVRIRRVGSALEGTIERLEPARRSPSKPAVITSKSGDCAELGSAMAVAIAIAVDPLAQPHEPAPEVAPAIPAAVVPPPPPPPPPPPVTMVERQPALPASSPEVPTLLHLGLGASYSIAALPSNSLGARLFVGVSHGSFEGDLEVRFDPPVALGNGTTSIDASLLLASVVPCFEPRIWLICGEFSLGSLRGSGLGFDHSRDDATFYAAVGARAGVELPIAGRFSFRAIAEGQIPIASTELDANGVRAWSTPAFAFSVAPYLVARFP